MKPTVRPYVVHITVCFLFGFFFIFCQNASAANIISGTVFDKARQPLADIDIELLDEYRRTVPGCECRQKTQTSGRYEFSVRNDGRYYIRVYAFRYDLEDETREIQITSLDATGSGGGNSFNLEDFYLQPRKGGLRDAELAVIFAQDIPPAAKTAYQNAVEDLSKKKLSEGYAGLKKAIEIFPKYFNALYRYGTELFVKKQYADAASLFFRAADVNPKSAMSYYFLGYSLDLMGKDYQKAAIVAAGEAYKLAPSSGTVLLLLGRLERSAGNTANAEKHLVQAKKVTNVSVPQIHLELSKLYSDDLKKYKEAADELDAYIKESTMSTDEEAKLRKIVAGLREKAKTQTAN